MFKKLREKLKSLFTSKEDREQQELEKKLEQKLLHAKPKDRAGVKARHRGRAGQPGFRSPKKATARKEKRAIGPRPEGPYMKIGTVARGCEIPRHRVREILGVGPNTQFVQQQLVFESAKLLAAATKGYRAFRKMKQKQYKPKELVLTAKHFSSEAL